MLDDLGTKNVLKFVRVIVVKTDFALRHVKLKRISALENCGIFVAGRFGLYALIKTAITRT